MVPVAPYLPPVLPWHTVVVRGETIVDTVPSEVARHRFPSAHVVDLRGHALLPGLVNAHTHAAMTLLRGLADDLPLPEWLQTRIWPAEAAFVSPEFVGDGTALACLEMLLGGTTTFNDMYFHPQDAVRAAVAAGIRVQAGITYVATPTSYARTEDEYIERGLDAATVWHGQPGVTFAWAPHSTYATSRGSWARLRNLREEHPFPVHTHVAETTGEVQRELEQVGCTPVAFIDDQGGLHEPFAAAHGVHLTDDDIRRLARSGATVVNCPSSNLKLASGVAPVTALTEAGVNVAIGTDGAASNNRLDMWQEMRSTALLAKVQAGRADALGAHTALTMATLGGARALGLDERIGTIEPAKEADLVAVDMSGVAAQPIYDPISHLVYVIGREDVTDVWVRGQQVVADRRCVSMNANDILGRVDEWRDRIRP